MKRNYFPFRLVLVVLILASTKLYSQDLFFSAGGERLQACTDRTMYVAGENISFSAVIINTQDAGAGNISRVYYCELITPDGNRITGGKYLLGESFGYGCLAVPEETVSGIYYLRFYTRFMRNISTAGYKYIMLKIINPFKTDVLARKAGSDTVVPGGRTKGKSVADRLLQVVSANKTFTPGQEVRIDIAENERKDTASRFCISVIPEFTYDDRGLTWMERQDTGKMESYVPETRGISLSGRLTAKRSGRPVPFARVNLSIIGNRDFSVAITDTSGKFYFTLPEYTGKRDIFLCAEELPDLSPEILIDNDFCSRPVSLPSPRFTLDENEMKAAYRLAVNSMVTSAYREVSATVDSAGPETMMAFYGHPTEVLLMDKYIELPTLGEYFTELPGAVRLKKSQGRRRFMFYTMQEEMSVYDPLVLVDWVAVSDMEKILAMSPQEIDRVELVNSMYIKGPVTYGGIISFISKKNDFAGIDLPKSGTFVSYRFLETCTEPGSYILSPGPEPDARNTAYWNPSVVPDAAGNAGISFPAPGTPGNYLVLLRWVNKDGEILLSEEKISVITR